MKSMITECVVWYGSGDQTLLCEAKSIAIIRIDDGGAGPYLRIRGENLEPEDDESNGDFFLNTEEEIDFFAAKCKEMLRQAEEANKEPE